MSTSSEIESGKSMFIDRDVIIMGAGCAGLACASKLYSFGFENIVVLEG